ncbi:MAG: hypothetical protein PHG66_05135 [Candidatus Colwellbacteria bacterium]|nr:hypothetical protein [Candidatus Colwellbacteria bacterium]
MTDQSLLLILGFAYVTAGFGALISPSFYMKIAKERSFLGGLLRLKAFLLILGGGYLVSAHRLMWIIDIPSLLALMGWIFLIKGGFTLAFPDVSTSMAGKIAGKEWSVVLIGSLVFGLGLTLTYIGLYM